MTTEMDDLPQEQATGRGTPKLLVRILAMFVFYLVVGVAGARVSSPETRLIVYGSLLAICYSGIAAQYAWRAFRQPNSGLAKPALKSLVLASLGMILGSALLRIPTTGSGFSDFALYSKTSAAVLSAISFATVATAIAAIVKRRRVTAWGREQTAIKATNERSRSQ